MLQKSVIQKLTCYSRGHSPDTCHCSNVIYFGNKHHSYLLTAILITSGFHLILSGVIQAAARAPGQIAKAWHVMMVTSAHVVTHVAVASAVPPHSRVIPGANTAMAIPAV